MSSLKIEWLTKSLTMFNAYNSENIETNIRGGRIYELLAIEVLKSKYDVTINKALIKRSNTLKYIFKHHKNKIKGHICVVDPYLIALGKFNPKKINIAIVHHIDEDLFRKNLLSKLFYFNLKRNLKKINTVVVVSEVWKTKLKNIGIKNCQVIYNAFDVKKYQFSDFEKNAFKEKYGFNKSQPLIYIGPNSSRKGIDEVLNTVDANKYQLIATGKIAIESKEVKTYYFSNEEFPLFLSCCDLVLCMSTMQEGWNRIAHESLLARTPVIGSGSGGMQELLEKSGQIIVKDLNKLNKEIDFCLKNSDRFIKLGYEYTRAFDLEYFELKWKALIEELV